MKLLLQLLANGLVNGAIFSLIAISFGLVYRTTRIFHIALGGIYTASSYFLFVFFKTMNLPLWVSLLLALFFASLLGWGIEKGGYRPFFWKEAGGGVVLIASLGIFIFLENSIALIFGNETKIISSGLEPSFNLGPVILTRIQIIQFLVGLLLSILLGIMVKKVKIVKALWAMGDEPNLVRVVGLPFYFLRSLVFLISSFYAAVASMLTSIDVGMDPHVGMSALLTGAVAVMVGGVERFSGWIAGAFVLAILQSLAVWKISARWTDLVTFSLLIIVLLTRPQGILGMRKRLEEL